MMNDRFEPLENGEVISVKHDTQLLSGNRTFRVGELNEAIESYLKNAIADWSEENNGWFTAQGLDCEALRFGSQGWQKGRIRLCLEFCPDEPHPLVQSASNISIPTAVNVPPEPTAHLNPPLKSPNTPATKKDVHHHDRSNLIEPTVTRPIAPAVNINTHDSLAAAVPIAGIAVMSTVAVAAISTPDTPEATNPATPHFTDTIVEPEEPQSNLNAPHGGSFDEIAFDFDFAHGDRGTMTPNGMMELDLTDLSLDFSEHDLLSFEANGISEASEDFINLQDLGKPENSGMLIDEVWNEMNQGNWPGIN
jgi:KGK domain